jgi:hypothetical protein
MRKYSVKSLTFWAAFLVMINSTGVLMGHCDSSKHHHSHHSHKCKLPKNLTHSNVIIRVIAALHAPTRSLDLLFTGEAYYPHPIASITNGSTIPPTIIVTDPRIRDLLDAVTARAIGGLNDLTVLFSEFGINATPFVEAMTAFVFAGEQYSIVIANSIPSDSYFLAWSLTADETANQLALALGLTPGSPEFNELKALWQTVATNEALAIQGFNGVLGPDNLLPGETQTAAALRFITLSRIATNTISGLTADLLILDYNHGHHCKICEKI